MAKSTVTLVTTTNTKEKKEKTREFSEAQALKLLTLSGTKWSLKDPAYKFDGKELVKGNKAKSSDTSDAKA